MNEVEISTEFIKLDQFLKFAGLANTGGHASIMIKNGEVKLNGETCKERSKKLVKGDIVEIENLGRYIVI